MAITQEYWTKLAQEAGASEEEMQAFQKVLANDKTAKALADRVMAREDYSRNMDALSKEKQRIDARDKEQINWYEKEMPKFARAQEQLNAYVQTFGDLPPDGSKPVAQAQVVDGKYISKEEHAAAIKEMYAINKQLIKAAGDYQDRFKRPLPVDDLEALALKEENRNRPVADVYKDFIAQDVESMSKKQTEEEIARRVAEGIQAEKAKLRFPAEETQRESSPFFTPIPKDNVPNARGLLDSFVQDFREAGTAKTT